VRMISRPLETGGKLRVRRGKIDPCAEAPPEFDDSSGCSAWESPPWWPHVGCALPSSHRSTVKPEARPAEASAAGVEPASLP
jgi:hypothetical protein